MDSPRHWAIFTEILVIFFIFTGTFFALPGLIGRPTHDRPAALRQADRTSPKGDLRRRDDLARLLFFCPRENSPLGAPSAKLGIQSDEASRLKFGVLIPRM